MALDVYKDWLGIPEGPRPPGLYALLRVKKFEDDPEKIRANYKKLNAHVRKYATGRYSTESQDLLNELARAMLCLTDPQRKREYDESQGREFADDRAAGVRKPMERFLVEQGTIDKDQVSEAEEFAEARGLSMRDALVQMKLVEPDVAAQALAAERALPYIDLEDMLPDDSVLDQVPRNVVKRNSILPLFIDDGMLLVACVDEPEPELEDELRLRFGVSMRAVMATPLAINQAIARYYAPGVRDEAAAAQPSPSAGKEKAKPREKKPREPAAPLSPEEQQQRKQIGLILICWGIVLPVLFDTFLLKPYVLPAALRIPYIPSITTLLVTPTVIWYVLKVYWKR